MAKKSVPKTPAPKTPKKSVLGAKRSSKSPSSQPSPPTEGEFPPEAAGVVEKRLKDAAEEELEDKRKSAEENKQEPV